MTSARILPPPFAQERPLTRVIGMRPGELVAMLGPASVERRLGTEIWFVFRLPSLDLRVVCSGADRPVASSCTASFDVPRATLEDAARSVGLWPACRPDQAAAAVTEPLIRRGLARPGGGFLSMTATVRNGHITQLTVFDEEPDW